MAMEISGETKVPQLGSRKSAVGRKRELERAPATRYADDGALIRSSETIPPSKMLQNI
jgi:hypothetical protein